MRLLVDHEINAALHNPAGNALAYVMAGNSPQPAPIATTQAHSTSLDLTIGEIFIPGSPPADLGGSNNGKSEHNLDQGHTAVIRTREILRMGPRRAAIGFPPARDSLKGLLMTNPGHIDPGYEGPLHCTVINMGHESYALKQGDRIMRVLFFELDDEPQALPLATGLPTGPAPSQITTQLLARLSIDFVDVERRAQSIADAAVSKATWRATFISALIPIGVTALTILGTSYFAPLQNIKDEIAKLQNDDSQAVTKLEEKGDVHTLDTNINMLRAQVAKDDNFDQRLKELEVKLNALSLGSQQGRRSR